MLYPAIANLPEIDKEKAAHFITRQTELEQKADYSSRCLSILRHLQQEDAKGKIGNANTALKLISEQIISHFPEGSASSQYQKKTSSSALPYGSWRHYVREIDRYGNGYLSPTTETGEPHFLEIAKNPPHRLKVNAPPKGSTTRQFYSYTINHKHKSVETVAPEGLDLTNIVTDINNTIIFHPSTYPDRQENYDDEHRWAVIARTYNDAINNSLSKDEREKSALECYWMVSQDMPLSSGSDTASRILLEFLSDKIGFEVPFFKQGVRLNTQAIGLPFDAFYDHWKSGDFADPAATAQEVIDWQSRKIQQQRLEASEGQRTR